MFGTKFCTVWKKGLFLSSVVLCLLSSCNVHKNVPYFKDLPDSTSSLKLNPSLYTDPVIQVNDILSITIQTLDPQNSIILNQSASPMPSVGTSSASSIGNQTINGFTVDKEGFVELQMIGRIQLAGLSTSKAKDAIRQKAAAHYRDPVVQVRFANYRVTVLGEVARPGTYTVPNENVSLLDAIGLAGDLTIYGKRTNVLVVRTTAAGKEFARFDLNSSDIFASPYFYLKQNDVVYIEPSKAKVATLSVARTQALAIASMVLSLLIIVASRTKLN